MTEPARPGNEPHPDRSGDRSRVTGSLNEMARVITAIDAEEVGVLARFLRTAWDCDRVLYVCGNGGSASTASHLAADWTRRTVTPGGRPFRVFSLTDNTAAFSSWANDAGYERVFADQLRALGRPGDLLLCLSASGSSRNILETIEEARRIGMSILAFGGFTGGLMRDLADAYVHVPSDDYGHIESAHLALEHCIAELLEHVAGASDPGGPAVIVDRDGVINENRVLGVRSWDEFVFIPGALEGLAVLTESGHRIVIATNQANIGRAHLSWAQLSVIHRRMTDSILQAGGRVDRVYVCAHIPEDDCSCRKPKPGLLIRAASEMGLDLGTTYVIGDHETDVRAALAAGARPVQVLSGRGAPTPGLSPDHVVEDLLAAARLVVKNEAMFGAPFATSA